MQLQELTLKTYEKSAKQWAKNNASNEKYWEKEINNVMRYIRNLNKDEISLLDIGCGNGRDAKIFSQYYNVKGIDYSLALLDLAKDNAPQADFELGNLYNLEYGKFDVIWACAVLLHIPKIDIPKVLKEIRNATREMAFISVKEGKGEKIVKDSIGSRFFSFFEVEEFTSYLDDFEILKVERREEKDTNWLNFYLR